MKFVVKEYDPIEYVLQQFLKFNATPPEDREVTEEQLIRRLSAHVLAEQG
ncbi:MAG TPA: hypothetical protein VIF43_02590 [Patescibacteria group bacterium]|jgi:hypothetical protein